ncbi:hypothetical protein R5R35_007134 [Gryllus longicercus]|uniref:Accessory gland protein n=1 Tax=Gryllus longicercus TaxID=2509291 RepID=A0AAN9Z863_9ORTH
MYIGVLTIAVLCFPGFVICALSHDVEFIPEELKTPGADKLGRSLSLGIARNERHRRDQEEKTVQKEIDIDQTASGSELVSPGFDIGYGELGQYVHGGQQAGGHFIQRQDAGNSHGEVGFYGNAGRKGSAGHLSDDAYIANHAAAHGDHSDSGFYGNIGGAQRGYNVGNAQYGSQDLNRKGLAASSLGSKGGYRKGHHSSGFHNSYHKDESGNNTSYYDEAVDDGGHFFFDARDGAFKDQAGNAFKGAFQDGAFLNAAKGNEGQYGAAQGYNDVRGQKGNYGRGEFFNDAQGYGQQKGNERYNQVAHLGQSEGGGAVYGNAGAGETYGHVVNKPYGNLAYNLPKQVPVVYEQITDPVVPNYPVQGKDYYHYPTYDYYPVGSYGPSSSDHYEKALFTGVKEPLHYEGVKGQGYATYVNPLPYVSHSSDVSDKYYGTYRGVTY